MYSRHNEGKSIVDERFIKSLKNKICKYVTSISKNAHIDKLNDIVNDSNKEINDKDSKFKIGDIVRILKYKSFFAQKSQIGLLKKKKT